MQELTKIFGSQSKAREIIYLLHDLKPVVRQGFYPEELILVKEFCLKNKLFLELSPYKIVLDEEKYSDKGIKVDKNNSSGMFFAYISKEQEKALLANLYETQGDHYHLGLILGYPECCAKFYAEEFTKGNLAPEFDDYDKLIDIRKRKTDEAIISHFPCSSNCQKSIDLAKRFISCKQSPVSH